MHLGKSFDVKRERDVAVAAAATEEAILTLFSDAKTEIVARDGRESGGVQKCNGGRNLLTASGMHEMLTCFGGKSRSSSATRVPHRPPSAPRLLLSDPARQTH